MIRFTAFGHPQTAGSKRAFALKRRDGSPILRANGSQVVSVVDDNPKSRDWKNQVASAAAIACAGQLLSGPLRVDLTFVLVRPKGHYRSGKNAGLLRDGAPEYPDKIPDVLKLARGVEDACTGVAWHDDAQIVCEVLRKIYGQPARCEVSVWPMSEVAEIAKELAEELF